jgi:hypothetical protein
MKVVPTSILTTPMFRRLCVSTALKIVPVQWQCTELTIFIVHSTQIWNTKGLKGQDTEKSAQRLKPILQLRIQGGHQFVGGDAKLIREGELVLNKP